MDELLKELQKFGLTQYEAKAYVSLVRLGTSNGYGISKNSGVPRARVYEVLTNLEQKGMILKEEVDGDIHYTSLPIDVFLKSADESWKQSFMYVKQELTQIEKAIPEKKIYLTTITGDEKIVTFAGDLIKKAKKRIVVSLWNEMYDQLVELLQEKSNECKVKGIVFQKDEVIPELTTHRRTAFLDDRSEGRWFIVSIDGNDVFYGHSMNKKGKAFYTNDPIHANLMEDYIWHDILVNKLVKKQKSMDEWINEAAKAFFS